MKKKKYLDIHPHMTVFSCFATFPKDFKKSNRNKSCFRISFIYAGSKTLLTNTDFLSPQLQV